MAGNGDQFRWFSRVASDFLWIQWSLEHQLVQKNNYIQLNVFELINSLLLNAAIMLCCCFRFRIPRTKQEIEADFQRRKIAKKFRDRLANIRNSEMDEMDLQKGNRAIHEIIA